MAKLPGPQMMLYRVWAVVRGFLRRLPTRLWRTAWIFIWRQIQKIRNLNPLAPQPGRSRLRDNHADASSVVGSHLPTSSLGQMRSSSCYELREPVRSLRPLESTSYTPHSASVPYFVSPAELSDVASDDSSSDFSIPIHVLPPEHPPSESGDLVHYPPSQQDQTTSVEAGMLWSAHRSSTNTLRSDLTSRFLSENASHSLHSSPRSIASSTSTLRDISVQSISVWQENSSRVSVFISPVAQPDTELPEHRSFRADSTLEVADHVYPLIPSKLKRYKRKRQL